MSLLRYLRSRRQPCFKKAHYRRNGWDVKPRHGKDPNALIVEDKWWHDSSKSVYWQYFKDDTSFNERTIQAVEFYDDSTSSTCHGLSSVTSTTCSMACLVSRTRNAAMVGAACGRSRSSSKFALLSTSSRTEERAPYTEQLSVRA